MHCWYDRDAALRDNMSDVHLVIQALHLCSYRSARGGKVCIACLCTVDQMTTWMTVALDLRRAYISLRTVFDPFCET
jgi:hypothetical protein